MQTFLPYASFARSAAVLDDRRLGKQRVETLQILRALHLEDYGWARHPAVLMWQGFPLALIAYGLAVIDEWRGRGHGDATRPSIAEFACPREALPAAELPPADVPPWLGWEPLHRSHQAALVRKDPDRYRAAFPDVAGDLPYTWPEPAADRLPLGPLTAWVMRAASREALAAFAEDDLVGLPVRLAGPQATRKQRRQFATWRDVLRVGDRVVVPARADLWSGVLVGAARERAVVGERYEVRDVRWGSVIDTAALSRPYQLQDPRLLFALRGEPEAAAS